VPQRAEEGEVARRILLGPEGGRQDGPRGIVDGPQEATGRLGGPEPGEGAPVELQEEARLGPARPAAPVAGRPGAPRGNHPGCAEYAPDRGPTDGQALHHRELLGEVDIVEASIPPAGEGDDLGPEVHREPMGRVPLPIAMDECSWPLPAQPHPQPPHLPGSHSQGFSGLAERDPLPFQEGEHVQPSSFFGCQNHLSSSM
jgi:hypothetical protein